MLAAGTLRVLMAFPQERRAGARVDGKPPAEWHESVMATPGRQPGKV
jgi:hypothetical protein